MDDFFLMTHPAIETSLNLLHEIVPKTNEMDAVSFGSFYCMLLEEWCLANHQDAVQFAREMAQMVCAINKIEGKYQHDTPLFEGEVF